jgi:hypothetical protein
MNFRIAIPTIARAETIKKKTINYLAQTDIDFSKVDLFLSDGNELPAYKESLKEYPINYIVTNKKHVNTQRNYMIDYYNDGQFILGIDDDIQSVQMSISEKKTIPLLNLTEFVEQAFKISQEHKFDMWGVNAVLNPYFMRNNISFNLKYIVACFYGWRNTRQEKAYVSTNPEYGKEDYERSIRYYIADGGLTRFNYVAPKTKYYSEDGGIQTYRTVEYEQKAVDWLLKTFPQFCVVNMHKKSKWPEVVLKDLRKRAKKK